MLAKVVGQVSAADWRQSVVLAKPSTMPVSGADEVVKFLSRSEDLWSGFFRVILYEILMAVPQAKHRGYEG